MLLALGARAPRDGEERQLVNVIEEMAVAAGVRSPRVMLLDSDVANAAAIGSSSDAATMVVSRRLLDELDRDETQGVVGHLVGSTGNGDLRISLIIASVFQAYGLLVTLVDTPFGHESRAAMMRVLRSAMGRGSTADRDAEAAAVTAMLTIWRSMRTVLLLPLLFTNLAIKVTLWITFSFVLEPLIDLMWRARRNFADATAVQLTRYPDSLARALQRLGDKGAAIPGSSWATHLFVIGPEGSREGRSTVEGGVATGSLLTFHPP